jgi:photosystem II stability/assembly factor-like uncharacterized protein
MLFKRSNKLLISIFVFITLVACENSSNTVNTINRGTARGTGRSSSPLATSTPLVFSSVTPAPNQEQPFALPTDATSLNILPTETKFEPVLSPEPGTLVRDNWMWLPWNNNPYFNKVFWKKVIAKNGVIWAVGTNNTLIKSIDEGESWTKIDIPVINTTDSVLTDISFFSASQGYIVSGNGRVLYTQNAGQSWSVQNIPVLPTGIVAWSETNQLLITYNGDLYEGNGNQFTLLNTGTKSFIRLENIALVPNTSKAIVVGDGIGSYDYSKPISNRVKKILNLSPGMSSLQLLTVPDQNLIIAGDTSGNYVRSSNSGEQFFLQKRLQNREYNGAELTHPFTSYISGSFWNSNKGIISTPSGIFDTDNMGISWKLSGERINASSVATFFDATNFPKAIAVTYTGEIYRIVKR